MASEHVLQNAPGVQITILLGSTVCLSIFIYYRYLCPISDIPGPFLSSFGTLWQLLQVFRGHSEEAITKLHEKHGPFVRISYKEVSVSHPDALQAVLGAPLRKGDLYLPFAVPNIDYNNLMSERDYKKHTGMKVNVSAGFSLSNIIKSEPYIDKALELFEERIAHQNGPVALNLWMSFLTWDILGESIFSKRFGFLKEGRDIGGSIANTYFLALYVMLAGHLQWFHALLLGNPILRWLDFQPSMHTFDTCMAAVEARKSNPEVRNDMMEHWLDSWRKHPERMREREVLCAALTSMGAGGDTISAALQAFVYLLIKNPKHMGTLQKEIDDAHACGELSRFPTRAETLKLPFLQACIKEALRLYPPVPWNLPRVVGKEGLTIAERHFTSGTLVSVNPWAIHRSFSAFGPDAHIYNPNRWLVDPDTAKSLERYLIPFGMGYNACPGRNLAMLEFNKISATLMRDFEIVEAEPKKSWQYRNIFIIVPTTWNCYMMRRTVSSCEVVKDKAEHQEKAAEKEERNMPTNGDNSGEAKEVHKEAFDKAEGIEIADHVEG